MAVGAELLSPAGNFEKLKIALSYGADAVYGGVSHFSLRIRSGKEFTYESFKEAIDYTHALGKKLYVTINGFPFNSQLGLLEKHIETVASMQPDAFIIAAPGVLRLSKKIAPHIPIHLSTQANVLNYLDAEAYYEMGVKRIVAAREVSLNDLKEFKKRLPQLEIEVFVHGSMCFAYSGRCLISAVQSGRVPNRGSCANDCRFAYTLYAKNEESGTLFRIEERENEGTYIFNAKDLNLMAHIGEILGSGVIDALKIEGRTKSPYYAATATNAYRKAIDSFNAGKTDMSVYQKELESIKNRGFSEGYLIQRPYERNNTQNIDSTLLEGTHQVYAEVNEDGVSFKAKDRVDVGGIYELLTHSEITACDNDVGKVWSEDGVWKISLNELKSVSGKLFDAVHSGNTNDILLPCPLPPFTFFRKEI
ncbi:MAG: U32 family peptidase [Campylobacteraceae bacterium]|jgi:putative protease|nr:U32 family peptidase [Campylobacteraceae bacterium]